MQIKSKAVGIDLGTTNCAVSIMTPADDKVVIHQDPNTQAKTTPSCLHKAASPREGESPYTIGLKAAGRVGTHPEPIRSIKSKMGESCTVLVTDEQMSPEQVSTFFLEEMKRQIESDVAKFDKDGEKWIVERAVVTVPAYFDQPAIDATRRAAEMAGLEVVDLLHEPTAAARYHCWHTGTSSGIFLVFDFGGGTFDVSILRITDGTPQVIGLSGNNRLGGDQIDEAIAEYIRTSLVNQGWSLELDPHKNSEDKLIWEQLLAMAEKTKKGISDNSTYTLRDELKDKEGARVLVEMSFDRPLTPNWNQLTPLEQIIYDVAKRTIPYCDEAIKLALAKAKIGLDSIDEIILAGGSTHLSLVRSIVKNELCPDPDPAYEKGLDLAERGAYQARDKRAKCSEPIYHEVDTIVSRGAAIEAAAAGLHVYNEARDTRVCFQGAGLTSQTEVDGDETIGLSNIGGVVERKVPDPDGDGYIWVPVSGGVVQLEGDSGGGDEATTGDSGQFIFPDVEIRPEVVNVLEFIICDEAGKHLATVNRNERVDDEIRKGKAPLPKSFNLEVVEGGELKIFELIPALTPLPAAGKFEFQHPGGDRVLLPLFQARRLIHTITVSVPPMPRGTPVSLSVNIDELAFITVDGTIGETVFDASIEPPAPRTMPTEDERASVDKRFESGLEFLAPAERMLPQLRWANANEAFENAVKAKDEALAITNFEEMESLADESGSGIVVLNPPRDKFDELVESCLKINIEVENVCKEKGVPHDKDEFHASIQAQSVQGVSAYNDANQKALVEATEALNGIRKTLVNVYMDVDPPTEEELAMSTLRNVQEETTRLIPLATVGGHSDLAKEMSNMVSTIPDLLAQVAVSPGEVRAKGAQMLAELERIRGIVDPGSGRVFDPSTGEHVFKG